MIEAPIIPALILLIAGLFWHRLETKGYRND